MVAAHRHTTLSPAICKTAREQSQSRLADCAVPGWERRSGPPAKGEQVSSHPQSRRFGSSALRTSEHPAREKSKQKTRGCDRNKTLSPTNPVFPVISLPPLGWGPHPLPGPTQSSPTGRAGWGGWDAAGGRAGPATALAINSFHMHTALPNHPLPTLTYQHTYSSPCEGPKQHRGCSAPPPPPPGAAAPVSCHPSWDGVPRAPRHPQGCGEPEVLVLQLCCSSKLANTHPKCGGQRWQTPSNLLLIGSPVVLLIPHCPHPPRTSCRTSPSMRTRSNPPGSNPHHPFPPTSNSVLTTPPPPPLPCPLYDKTSQIRGWERV